MIGYDAGLTMGTKSAVLSDYRAAMTQLLAQFVADAIITAVDVVAKTTRLARCSHNYRCPPVLFDN